MIISLIASGLATTLIGMVWYSPYVFGTAWMRMSGITPEAAEQAKKRMPLMALIGLIAAMCIAWVTTYVNAAWGFFDWIGALDLGFWCWAGFIAPTMLSQVLWDQKPFKLYLINVGFWLVALLVISQIVVFASTGSWDTFTDVVHNAGIEY